MRPPPPNTPADPDGDPPRPDVALGRAILPEIGSREQYRALRHDRVVWSAALRAICQRHRIAASSIDRMQTGSHVVARVHGDRFVKLYAPPFAGDAARERAALEIVARRTTLPVPHIITDGELEGWPYVLVTAVPGIPLDSAWASLDSTGRLAVMEALGQAMRELHSVDEHAAGRALALDWASFVSARARASAGDHASAGAPHEGVEQIRHFVDALPPLAPLPGARLLHADLGAEHIFIDPASTVPRITGVIDFGDAKTGDPCYDFVAPAFLVCDDPTLRRAWLRAYGFAPTELDEELSRRLMAYTVLHEYGRLPDYLAMFGATPPATLPELERRLWSFD